MWNILLILCASLICAVLYRMGGSGNYPRQTRIIGVPFITYLLSFFLGVHSFWLFLAFVLTIGAISTYWDFLWAKERNFDNFWLHGWFIGLAAFPVALSTGHWWLFFIRCILLAVFMGIWSHWIWKWDIAEETGRGFIVPATIWMIC